MTNPKRDFSDAVPAAEYYRSTSKPSLKKVIKSQASYRVSVPKEQHRDVLEKVIQKEIIDLLKWRGAWVHKAKSANLVGSGDNARLAATDCGVPDLLVCYDGYFLAFEVKRAAPGVRVSGEQVAQIRGIIDSGGVAHVVWSVEQVEAILDSIDDNSLLTGTEV